MNMLSQQNPLHILQYRQTSNISPTKFQNLNVARLVLLCAIYEDVFAAAPSRDAPTTSEWLTMLFPTKVWLISEVWG